MATITSAASGNWSAGATWVGGVVPTSVDDVVIAGHTIQADVDITVLSISRNGAGTVVVSTSRTITCTGSGMTSTGSATSSLISITALTGNSVIINSNLNNQASGGSITVSIGGTANVFIFGNLIAQPGGSTGSGTTVRLSGNGALVNITGNIQGSSQGTAGNPFCVNITGTGSILNVLGNVSAGSIAPGIVASVSSSIIVNGVINPLSTVSAISSSSTVLVGGIIYNVSGRMAVSSNFISLLSTIPTQWLFQTENALVDKTLYDVQSLPTIPVVGDVRNGVSYANGALTGTLAVPSPSDVRSGVPTDNTVGTAALTPADFWDYLTSGATAGSMGERVAAIPTNPASVESTGAQIASFNT
jgi:hypothetical protein